MNILSEIYFNPSSGFIGADKLYQKVKQHGLTRKNVKDFLDSVEVNQRFKKPVKQEYYPIYGKERGYFQCDLAFLPKWKKWNNGKDVLLTIININTRKAYAYGLSSKKAGYILEAFKDFLRKADVVNVVFSDNGSEFLNKSVQDLFKNHSIEHVTFEEENHQKLGIIERFNRTLKMMINKYMKANHTVKWIDVLNELINNYNNSYHSSIKMTPNEMTEDKEYTYILNKRQETQEIKDNDDFDIGDTVRILKSKKTFMKEGTTWSKSLYKIVGMIRLSYVLVE